MTGPSEHLHELARRHGIEPFYRDGLGQQRVVPDEGLLAVLQALGAPVHRAEDADDALRQSRIAEWRTPLEPVLVSWDGAAPELRLRLAKQQASGRCTVVIELEDGSTIARTLTLDELTVLREGEVEGTRFVELGCVVEATVPLGYHQVSLELHGAAWTARLIAAPSRARRVHGHHWGVFMPTYALRTDRTSGAGDLGDLRELVDRVGELGGGMVGTLPLLSTFLDEPFEPSPYVPVSRLFWNELFLELEGLPELAHCPEAQQRMASAEYARELGLLRGLDLVDYRRAMEHKRGVLQALSRCAFADGEPAGLREFVREQPRAHDYARFRAAVEQYGRGWRKWPAEVRETGPSEAQCDPERVRYHLYVQWRMHEQLRELGERAQGFGPGIYLDLPLGVHPDGYDSWAEGSCFASGVAAGAPPDDFFTRGQNWGFAPFHPRGIRQDGYDYVAACFRNQLRHAGVLRIDHVMWMHRTFCVPEGMEATEGAYVRYRPEELYAILALESHRQNTMIVGEDLGTVPDEVRQTMSERDVLRMYVVQYELDPEAEEPIHRTPENSMASVNTHDMPPFAAFWQERDVDDRIEMGLLDEQGAKDERAHRRAIREETIRFLRREGRLGAQDDRAAVLRALLEHLAADEAQLLMINLEDLWLETLPQNVPGTGPERPNWRRRARHRLRESFGMRQIVDTLSGVDSERKSAK
jgi:4-alpha-glucanotransferase